MDVNTRVKDYLSIIADITTYDDKLVEFVIAETIDRVKLYLNVDTVPTQVERILANIVNNGIKRAVKSKELGTDTDKEVSSLSDNGQSISYTDHLTHYFTTAYDEELFSGFTSLLNRYRRANVVRKPKDDESNS